VVREGRRLNLATPLCHKLLEMIHELESGKRKLGLENYAELAAATSPK
jgi:ketopantoate reductase